ncbi:hypothetical protein QZH41_015632, partial [Actinostola sp. cb2023]
QTMDTPVLLTKKQIKAIKKMVFSIIRSTMKINHMETDFPACGVNLQAILVWAIREQRLYGADTPQMEFNVKIDGRPLGGKDQISIGVVPIDFAKKSPESALSVYPVAIANCKEERKNVKQLIKLLNSEKNWLKKHGLTVDGKHYDFKFTVTLDYKALLLLLVKEDDENFVLGGRGYGKEFCAFCDAVRVNCDIFPFSGCTERQILNNIENIVTTALPTDKIAKYLVECKKTSKKLILDYITFTEERKELLFCLLYYYFFIVLQAFLQQQLQQYSQKQEELVSTFSKLSDRLKTQQQNDEPKKKKRKKIPNHAANQPPNSDEIYSPFSAQLQVELFLKVFTGWKEIALTLRDKVFGEEDQEEIDIHEIECKEWGHLLKHLFGVHLGTGDYGHLTIDHSAMLLREFGSLYKYSGQGFEASHKLHRQLFSKATNHDSSGPGHSLNQILTHWYATELMSLRYAFRNAKECIFLKCNMQLVTIADVHYQLLVDVSNMMTSLRKRCFKFRGFGWKSKDAPKWSSEDVTWRGNGGVNLGVHIGGFGQFTEDGLSDLIKFIGISKTARMVAEERQWLQQFNFINNEDELEELTEALWHKPTNGIIIREGKKSIDVMSYSGIVSHIDNFVVDISIEKYLQEVNGNDALYLPSELYDWMKSNSTKFKTVNLKNRVLGRKNVCDINVIIAPVHMNDHWGLVVIDIHNEKLMFDDGMKVYPPTTTLQNIKDALDILCVAFPSWQSLQSRFWTSCMNFDRFGMPSQVSSSPGNYTGTGSCGIGIILAARDFIDNGPSAANNIKWKYSEMNYHRLNLMKQILKWQ